MGAQMIEFITSHPLLTLGIAGAIITTLVSISKRVWGSMPARYTVMLALIGCAILIGQQVMNFNEKQNEARRKATKEQIEEEMQTTRTEIIRKIEATVTSTKVTVDSIAESLENKTFDDVGVSLVTVRSSGMGEFNELAAFAKGSPEMWVTYADWLAAIDGEEAKPSLSLTFNAGNSYDVGLLLAYLLTSERTRSAIENVIPDQQAWGAFPDDSFIEEFGLNVEGVDWVLFFDRTPEKLIAYADATEFIRELAVYQAHGLGPNISALLNQQTSEIAQMLRKRFASIRTDVFSDSGPPEVVRDMITRRLSVAAVVDNANRYVVRLENAIKLAAASE